MTTASKPPFLAFASDSESAATLRQFCESRKWPAEYVIQGDIATAVGMLSSRPSPEILFVDVPSVEEAKTQIDKLADVCDPGVKVIVSGAINEYSFYCWLVEIGIANYLLKPISVQALEAAHQKIIAPPVTAAEKEEKKEGQVISVIGTRGGVGSTTLAVNLATILASTHKQNVALMDLDPHEGTIAMALDLEPGRGLRDVLEKPDRVDAFFLDRVMVKCSENLQVLSAEEPFEEFVSLNEKAAEVLLTESRKRFSHVVVDVPRQINAFTRKVLALSDTVIVVTETTMLGLRDALRLSDYLRDVLKVKPPLFVANREGVAGKHHMSRADFEKGLSAKLSHVVPFAADAYASSNAGEVLAEAMKKSPAVQEIFCITRRFVEAGAASKEDKKPKGIFDKLLKK